MTFDPLECSPSYIENAFLLLVTVGGDSVGVATVTDGICHPSPRLWTSRPMTDEEVGRILRLALPGDP